VISGSLIYTEPCSFLGPHATSIGKVEEKAFE
jgi:hypothetical protein